MIKETVLITGGTSGVGKATVLKLAELSYKIVLLARSEEKASKTIKEIKLKTPDAELDFILGDLSSLSSIKKAAAAFKEKYSSLNILINNAGGVFSKKEFTEDGLEWGFQVNHLGHFLLTNLLIESLLTAGNAKVINLSSEAHRMGNIDFNNLNCEKKFSTWKQYGTTKLMNLLFSKSLANNFPGLSAYAVHPGVVRTGFGANNSGILGWFNKMPFLITPEQGAETTVFLCTTNAAKLTNGGYYKKSKLAYAAVQSQDIDIQEGLWAASLKILKEKGFIA